MKITKRHIAGAILAAFILAAGFITFISHDANAAAKHRDAELPIKPIVIAPSEVRSVLNDSPDDF